MVLEYYGLHIAQITPSGVWKIICFVMFYSALNTVPSITVFRCFNVTMSTRDWLSFSLCQGLVEICDGIPTSIKLWKKDSLFIHASTFPGPMAYGDFVDMVLN